MPKNSLEDIKYLVEQDAWVYATRSCAKEVLELGLTQEQAKNIILALRPQPLREGGDFVKEWKGKATTDFGDIDADVYYIWFNEEEQRRCRPYMGQRFYVKLGIHTDVDGDVCLVVSLHLENRPA